MVAPASPMPRRERGLIGARRRWGPARILRLNDLTSAQRALIEALVGQMKASPVSDASGEATTGGTSNADRRR
jgi:hypothetical protein